MTDAQRHQLRLEARAMQWLRDHGWRVWDSVPGGAASLVAVRYGRWALIEVRDHGFGDRVTWNRLWEAARLGQALPLWKTDSGWWQVVGPGKPGQPRPKRRWRERERSDWI
ncbi:hypothetical protein [Sulfobacillus harzensis]|uniref:VRR-NUC domain-containing protein n=1 Tax=Sulfobacillus harzensis TaxID=2729629 RepID=A0A7Y0Q4V9_9FIRM|nr:hypothetical protein [Sulfobacillus harzensis]NMP24815.1 hypothetical protein [Sulfobacillus harzensis]